MTTDHYPHAGERERGRERRDSERDRDMRQAPPLRPHASSAAAAMHGAPGQKPARQLSPAKPAAPPPPAAARASRSPRPDTLQPIQIHDRNGGGDASRPSSKGSSAVDSERSGQKTNRMGLGHLVD
jgi:hypothetical protein